jgi:hypothetical protein
MEEKEKQKIEKEAREILIKFGKTLDKIKIKVKTGKEELGGFREEGTGVKGNEDFRKRILSNAPNKNEDSIIAEKKKW